MTPFRGILFDLDGTLVDSLQMTFDAFNHGLRSVGAPVRTPEEVMAHFGPGEDEIFTKLTTPTLAAAAYEASIAYTDQNMGRTPLHAGVAEMLARFRSAGIPMSVVTGRSWKTTEIILRHHGLLDAFVTIVAHDHVNSSKPSPEGLELALSRMNLKPTDACYVGDTPMDMLAARRAGMEGIAALWDRLASRENLEKQQPRHWAQVPAEVWSFFHARSP